MFKETFTICAKEIKSIIGPKINKDGSYYVINPMIFDADKIMRYCTTLGTMEQIVEKAEESNKLDELNEGLNIFIAAHQR